MGFLLALVIAKRRFVPLQQSPFVSECPFSVFDPVGDCFAAGFRQAQPAAARNDISDMLLPSLVVIIHQ
jgi:hypothetical protein